MSFVFPAPEVIEGLPADGGPDYNRLIFEKSPYLLQHAANPVDWYPWGKEAFLDAESQDKPVFLSIGYATCHWCHVMEKESFEDPEAAALINKYFIPIKVDREERPDIDQIYMAVCQALTGSGGWPLTVLLTPDKKPFFAGTYFPKESRFGRQGLMDLLPKAADLWANGRDELLQSAENITRHLQEISRAAPGELDPGVVEEAYLQLSGRFDEVQGGFGTAPKFPSPHNLIFLLRYWKHTGEARALEMAEKTLQQMRLGGIYDQVGFGFHRYSTDAAWRLPHFEKMLYDQAMLVLAYTEAYQATGKELYAAVVREILSYVNRDMTAPQGGFFSAEDADSEGEEGLFYLWTLEEFLAAAGEKEGSLLGEIFNLHPDGNYSDEATHQLTGRNLLYLDQPLSELAGEVGIGPQELAELWGRVRQELFAVREGRIHPLKDDKILTDWNGLMIAAYARAGAVLNEPAYTASAARAVDFIWNHLRSPDGKLLKRHRDGEGGLAAHLDDYAFLTWGLLELYQADFQTDHLVKAVELTEIALADFWDDESGGFYFTSSGGEGLIHRSKEIYDGAVPSGNSVAFYNLLRLSRLLSRAYYEDKALQIGEAFASQINQLPQGHTQLMSGLLGAEGGSSEVVIAGYRDSPDTREMIQSLRGEYHPDVVVLLRSADPDERLFELVPVLREQVPQEGRATAYVCQDFQCSAPTTDAAIMLKLLERG